MNRAAASLTCTPCFAQRYNARASDCSRCPASLNASILHFACTPKPWVRQLWLRGAAARGPLSYISASDSLTARLDGHIKTQLSAYPRSGASAAIGRCQPRVRGGAGGSLPVAQLGDDPQRCPYATPSTGYPPRQDRPRGWWASATRCVDGKRDWMCDFRAPCVSAWFELWFEAETQMLQGLAAQGVLVNPISKTPIRGRVRVNKRVSV